ncbi:MAG: 2-oxo acid dehydrogenase subunit E2 [Chloroflexi bacterium]|nr:2-oxo acid dehydrogenase subunit E2 [Chloroflexota bacterium]
MNDTHYRIVPFPKMRLLVVDAMRAAAHKPMIHGLIEVDVTVPRQRLRAQREKTGAAFSFTAFLIYCLGQALEQEPVVNAYRNWRGQLVLFTDADISTIIETDTPQGKFPQAHVLRRVNRRTLQDIHDEMRAIQQQGFEHIQKMPLRALRLFLALPGFVRLAVYRIIMLRPQWFKQAVGTVGVTAVGMFGTGAGWGISFPLYNLNLVVGGIAQKPAVIDGHIVAREILNLTLSFDHVVIDGAPAARFAAHLKQLIESGFGLPDTAAS